MQVPREKTRKIKLLNNKKDFRLDKFIEMALFASDGYYLRKNKCRKKKCWQPIKDLQLKIKLFVGVTKVAGRLSNLASGAMSQLQVSSKCNVFLSILIK